MRVEKCLERFEKGDLNAWWHLVQEMQLEKNGWNHRCAFGDDLTTFPGWKAASEDTQSRIVSAAKQYLVQWKSKPCKIQPNKMYYPDMAGYRAFVLLQRVCHDFIQSLDIRVWDNLASSIISFPATSGFGSDSEKRLCSAIELAYSKVPKRIIKTLARLIDQEDATEQNGLFVLRRVDECMDGELAFFLLSKARDRTLKPASVADLVSSAFSSCPKLAESLARARLLGSVSLIRSGSARTRSRHGAKPRFKKGFVKPRQTSALSLQGTRRIAGRKEILDLIVRLMSVIWENGSTRWQTLWPLWVRDVALFKRSIEYIANERRLSRVAPSGLKEEELADLYILLERHYPHEGDPQHDGVYASGVRDSVMEFRESILNALKAKGTGRAVTELRRIESVYPHLGYLGWVRREAQVWMLESTWTPLTVGQLRELLDSMGRRIIRCERDLAGILIESISRLQIRLRGETPSVRDIWDYDRTTGKWAPIDENGFSDYVKRHLEIELAKLGIISMREVEIRRGYSEDGERTDIYVAVAVATGDSAHEIVRVIVEVKGCWHRELKTALDTQLKERYLTESKCTTGIYLVGWFLCNSWRTDDYRRTDTPKWTVQQAQDYFKNQAKQASSEGISIHAVVLNTSLI